MRVYEDSSLWAQEFSIDAVLELADDGRFHYSEYWHCYGAGLNRRARGVWRADGEKIVLHFETAEEGLYFGWKAGEQLTVVANDDSLDFGGSFSMRLNRPAPPKPSAPPRPTEGNSAEKAAGKNPPRTAKLHFKDGRILEKPLPNDSLFGLFTQTYYRLTDGDGQTTNIFRLRPNWADRAAAVVEYVEMDRAAADDREDE